MTRALGLTNPRHHARREQCPRCCDQLAHLASAFRTLWPS